MQETARENQFCNAGQLIAVNYSLSRPSLHFINQSRLFICLQHIIEDTVHKTNTTINDKLEIMCL